MRYLIGTKSYGLFYKKYPAVIEGFSDANWNTLSGDSLSTTGYDNYYEISRLNSTDCHDVEGLKDKKQKIRGDRG